MVAFVSATTFGILLSVIYLAALYGAMFPKRFFGDEPDESIEEFIKNRK